VEGYVKSGDYIIQGATISIVMGERSTLTDSEGFYIIDELNPANYLLKADKQGYHKSFKDMCLFFGKVIRADFELLPLPGDMYEYNDTFLSASAVFSSVILGTIHNLNDVDYYKRSQLGILRIYLIQIPSTCNYDIELYDSEYNKIGESHEIDNNDEYIETGDINPRQDLYIKIYSRMGSNSISNYKIVLQ